MQIISAFFNMIGVIVKAAFGVVGGVIKFSLGMAFVVFVLLVLVFLGLLHVVGLF